MPLPTVTLVPRVSLPFSSSVSFETVEQVQAAAAIIREPKTAANQLYLFAVGTLTEFNTLGRRQIALTSHFENLVEPRTLRSLSHELLVKLVPPLTAPSLLVNKYSQPPFVEHFSFFVPGKQATFAANGVWAVTDVVLSLVSSHGSPQISRNQVRLRYQSFHQ